MLASPPITITPGILSYVAEIAVLLGAWEGGGGLGPVSPQLRRGNRIRTVQASLAIENNSLTVEQVTAILDGKRVLGHPKEILEVQNALACYDAMPQWNPFSVRDLLTAHGILMRGLAGDAGKFRRGGVGIFREGELIHMAPPPAGVPGLVKEVLDWAKSAKLHPLVVSTAIHYELEFIHPFSDGNGRMGRLWQSLVLARWNPVLAALPVETVVKERQEDYYAALRAADAAGDAAPFVEFMLEQLLKAMKEAAAAISTNQTDQVSDHVSDQVKLLLKAFYPNFPQAPVEECSAETLMERLGLRHKPSFRSRYLRPALEAGYVEMTQPDSPRSPTQRYRLTKGFPVSPQLPHSV